MSDGAKAVKAARKRWEKVRTAFYSQAKIGGKIQAPGSSFLQKDGDKNDESDAKKDKTEKKVSKFVITEKSTLKKFWDVMINLLITVDMIFIPFTLGFNLQILDTMRVTYFVFDIFCCVNIILSFFTAFQKDIEW